MKLLIAFGSLQPIWTRRGLEMVWYVYLLATALSLAQFGGVSLWGKGEVILPQLAFLSATFLFYLAHLALVRIFLEMASKFLTDTSAQSRASGTGTPHADPRE
jgi:hypothetical protein